MHCFVRWLFFCLLFFLNLDVLKHSVVSAAEPSSALEIKIDSGN